jgi:cytochrome c peroxidase
MGRFIFIVFLTTLAIARQFEAIEEPQNYDDKKVALGKKLFADPILSKDGSVSCLSCHFAYGADPKAKSVGIDNHIGEFNALSVFNSSFNFFYHWSGEIKSLHEQFDNPVQQPIEMAATEEMINQKLNDSKEYVALFKDVYGKKPDYDLVKDAVVAFQETLVTPAKFDAFLTAQAQLSPQELRGFEYFKNYGCGSCHNGKNLGGNSIQKFGTIIPRIIDGKEQGYFKVPSLRNVEKTAPYFHDGAVVTLRESIELMGYHNLGTHLSPNEIEDIEAFLKTLTGKLPATWDF